MKQMNIKDYSNFPNHKDHPRRRSKMPDHKDKVFDFSILESVKRINNLLCERGADGGALIENNLSHGRSRAEFPDTRVEEPGDDKTFRLCELVLKGQALLQEGDIGPKLTEDYNVLRYRLSGSIDDDLGVLDGMKRLMGGNGISEYTLKCFSTDETTLKATTSSTNQRRKKTRRRRRKDPLEEEELSHQQKEARTRN
jgi:hypothetical protein